VPRRISGAVLSHAHTPTDVAFFPLNHPFSHQNIVYITVQFRRSNISFPNKNHENIKHN